VRIVKSWLYDQPGTGFAKDYVGQMARLSRGSACGFFSRAGPSPPGRKENPPANRGRAASDVDDSLGFLLTALLAALSWLLLLTRLLAAATLLTTLLLTWLLLSTAALLTALLATLAALLTTLSRILICHDAYVSFLGKFPQLHNPACTSTFRTVAHIFTLVGWNFQTRLRYNGTPMTRRAGFEVCAGAQKHLGITR
jgi:hypothetical protein